MADRRARKEAEKVFRAKMARRQALANLPIEKKILILTRLQKMATQIRATAGKVGRRSWNLQESR